ncbi:MAG: peptide deformylase [Magnetospirillum sp. WYHS-4]
MSILKIARMGHPVLAAPAQPVADPTAPEIAALVVDMVDTLRDAGGVGLAAPQVHIPLRLVIFFVPEARAAAERYRAAGLGDDPDPEGGPVPLTALINPVIEPLGEEMAEAYEGCLSLPGMSGPVPRYMRIRYRGLDLEGRTVDRIARGFHARVVQHECDHLDGILYPMRIKDLSRFGYSDEMRKGSSPDSTADE